MIQSGEETKGGDRGKEKQWERRGEDKEGTK
jgi:hypothetical protein